MGSSMGRKRVFADRSISVGFQGNRRCDRARGNTVILHMESHSRIAKPPPSKDPRFLLVGSSGARHFRLPVSSRMRAALVIVIIIVIVIVIVTVIIGQRCRFEDVAFRSLSQIAGA